MTEPARGSVNPGPYRRVLLKLSGEFLADAGNGAVGISLPAVEALARLVLDGHRQVPEVQLSLVVGAGNLWRGARNGVGLNPAASDGIGMVGTVMNALALQEVFAVLRQPSSVLSAVNVFPFAEPYSRREAERRLEAGEIVLFAGGTGNPFVTTDTAATLRAMEIGADIVLMAKNRVDGVYTADPRKNENAQKLTDLTHSEVVERGLSVMDATAITLCMERGLPIAVFDLYEPGNLARLLRGERVGTLIR